MGKLVVDYGKTGLLSKTHAPMRFIYFRQGVAHRILSAADHHSVSVSMFELDRANVARHVTTELLQCVTHRPDYGIGIARDCRL